MSSAEPWFSLGDVVGRILAGVGAETAGAKDAAASPDVVGRVM